MFEADGGPTVEISASERDPAVVSALDFEVVQDSKGRASRKDFGQACEGGFKFRDGECDGFHEVVFF